MGNIVLLDDLTINKIAAGEVIERPASVIKEMVENSIDAGATNITVEIKNGGISYIRVTDNGKGIPEDDLEIAFERHATSKIRSADDLSTVTSMGFRGEALASIAAIARVEMVSKTAEQENGFKVVVEGGNALEKSVAGCPTGTSITVTNLFYNTPVRYKFLKKDFTEAGYIEDAVTRIALVHPEIAIKLINSGKTIIQTNGNGDLKTVIYSIYGKDVAGALIETEYTYEDMHIYGVIGKPEIARSNRANQIFFVNKRFIKDKALTSAAEKAYKGMIPIGKFSFLVLNVDMNPSKVDVNVHPAKLEVRFEEESTVFKAVYHAIRDALLKAELVADTDNPTSETRAESGLFGNRNSTEYRTSTNYMPNIEKSQDILRKLQEMKERLISEQTPNETLAEEPATYTYNETPVETPTDAPVQEIQETQQMPEFGSESVVVPEEIPQPEPLKHEEQEDELPQAIKAMQENTNIIEDIVNSKIEEKTENFEEMYLKLFGTKPVEEKPEEEPKDPRQEAGDIATLGNTSIFDEIEEYQKPSYKFIGIVFNTYIIIEIDKEMYILDQHAAHERILYEKVKTNYYNDDTKDSQLMLLPDIITLSHKEMEIAKDNMEMFKKAGFMLEEFGENTLKLTGVPEMCLDLETKEMFLETLDEINSVSRTAKQEIEERFIATVACKAAVKANMALTKEEVDSLMDKLLSLPNPFTCPHGRPTAIKMSRYDIEKKFARA
ncbi:MAG: DNA mismatch repair endonuclease MutL [Clostridia bacterium]|nr:DNA mismatch repair endonuclease MutL [Clostridia bacterium]